MVSLPRSVHGQFLVDPQTPEWFIGFTALLTHAHVMMVFYRSHANPTVFRRFRWRFTVVPIAFLAAFYMSPALSGLMAIVALYWDEWHTLMQTFGLTRIYDARAGNDPNIGRKLDMGMCFVLGLLPHMLLLTYMPENVRTEGLFNVLAIGGELAARYGHYIHSLKIPLIVFAAAYTVFYVYSYVKLVKKGYKISRTKIALMATTGTTAVLIATFYSVSDAGHFMNMYHSLQYLFIVCVLETPQITGRLNFPKINKRLLLISCGVMVVSIAFVAGLARLLDQFAFLGHFWLLSSLCHFWYDGFIWSVRKKDV
jgi:hypothetical protein